MLNHNYVIIAKITSLYYYLFLYQPICDYLFLMLKLIK